MRAPPAPPTAIALVAAALVCGCAAQRKLEILSDPPGALVRLDDRIVGSTPYETTFDAYGTRRVTLYKAGYRTRSELVELATPWYARFPLDIVSEVLIPVGWKDFHRVEIALQADGGPVTRPDLTALLQRAESLRLAEPSGPRPLTRPAPAGSAPRTEDLD